MPWPPMASSSLRLSPKVIRAVTHRDVTADGIDRAIAILRARRGSLTQANLGKLCPSATRSRRLASGEP